MIIREYECKECGRFDQPCKMSDAILKECPKCGGSVHRVFTPAPIIWKTDGACGKVHMQGGKE